MSGRVLAVACARALLLIGASGRVTGASGLDLTTQALEDSRWRLVAEVKRLVTHGSNRVIGRWWRASGQSDRRVQSPQESYSEEPNGSISRRPLFKPLGQLKLTLLAICIDIATL